MTSPVTKAHRLLAPRIAYLKWHTYEILLDVEGFTLSVPLMSHLEGVWKLAARYSRYPAASPQEKLATSGLSFDYNTSNHGPVLTNGIDWMECRTIQRADLGGDHGLIIGQAQQVWFNPEFLNPEGIPHTQTSPLMQVAGNRFTAAAQISQIPYRDQDS